MGEDDKVHNEIDPELNPMIRKPAVDLEDPEGIEPFRDHRAPFAPLPTEKEMEVEGLAERLLAGGERFFDPETGIVVGRDPGGITVNGAPADNLTDELVARLREVAAK